MAKQSFTTSERRGLILLAVFILLVTGIVWLCSHTGHKSIDDVPVSGMPTERTASGGDSVNVRRIIISGKKKAKRTGSDRKKVPIEPRRSPLDEPVPETR